ncbi:MAG: phosphoribosyltransferase [Cyanobium sp.]|jgi:putative phosphoribosyl transferase|nr:phosphoribosyltransferase family protein [Synechococcaceae cyanobacterium]
MQPAAPFHTAADSPRRWPDRQAAGLQLADQLRRRATLPPETLLLALPRGGVAVAAAMASRLGLPLATWSARKLADPSQPELAIGAIAPGGVVLWELPPGAAWPSAEQRQRLLSRQGEELWRRQRLFGDPDPAALHQRPLILVDDGIATGLTARAALESLRQLQPASLTLAVPVVDRRVGERLGPLVDRLEVLALVDGLQSVGQFYESFEQLEDQTVLRLLGRLRPHDSL